MLTGLYEGVLLDKIICLQNLVLCWFFWICTAKLSFDLENLCFIFHFHQHVTCDLKIYSKNGKNIYIEHVGFVTGIPQVQFLHTVPVPIVFAVCHETCGIPFTRGYLQSKSHILFKYTYLNKYMKPSCQASVSCG